MNNFIINMYFFFSNFKINNSINDIKKEKKNDNTLNFNLCFYARCIILIIKVHLLESSHRLTSEKSF